MKTAVIYVFSGTGNTLIAAKEIKEALKKYEVVSSIYNIRAPFNDVPNPSDYDFVLFGYPIHAFNSPKIFLDFVKSLPKSNNKLAFIFKTSGEPFWLNNASSFRSSRMLKKKGYLPLLDKHLLMPYYIMFRYKDSLAKQMFTHTKGMAKVIANYIYKEQYSKLRFNIVTVLIHGIFRIQWLGARLNSPFYHVKKNICTSCGKCIKECPAANITMVNGYPKFHNSCTMCMNCVVTCPYDAVRPGVLNLWRVNKHYPFKKLIENDSISDNFINKNKKGYFGLFKKYYNRTYKEINDLENN